MGRYTRSSARRAGVKVGTQTATAGKWLKRDAYTGRFIAVKKSGGTFKGVKREK